MSAAAPSPPPTPSQVAPAAAAHVAAQPATVAAAAHSDAAMMAQFLRLYALRYAPVYALGLALLVATNWLTVAIPRLQKEVFDELAGGRHAEVVHGYARWIAAAALAVIFVRTGSRILFFNPGRTIEFRLRNEMLRRLLAMSPAWFRGRSLGDLMARASDDATYVRALVGFSVIMVLNIVLAAGLAIVQMLRTDAWLTLACVLPLLAAVALLRMGVNLAMSMMKQGTVALGALSGTVLETYKGIAVVQGAAAEAAFIQRFDQANDLYTQISLKQTALRTFLMPIVAVVGNLCIFILLFIGGRHVVQGQMTVGDLAAYAAYIGVLVGALASSGWVIGVLQRGAVSLRRVWDVASLASDLPVGDQPLPPRDQGIHLKVQGLSWRHPDAPEQPPVLAELSFEVRPGQVLGICGPVGSGKSTLVALLGRLAAVPAGAVTLDGVDLCAVAEADLRRAVAVVPQEPVLFSRSIRENIAFVDRVEDIDEARVRRAASLAQLDGEIARMPQGLDTVIGEKGLTLSGGQRQRLQIARALYRGFRLLVLDDVLSAVDHDTEERLLQVLRGQVAASGTSAVIASHRLSALARADEILVFADPTSAERGRVVERGSHAQLLALGGVYAGLWAAQHAQPS